MSGEVEARGSVQLRWAGRQPEQAALVVERAIEVIEAMGPTFRPTLVQLTLREKATGELPPRWLFSLEERGLEETSDQEDAEGVFRIAERIDPSAIRGLAREALAGEVELGGISVEVRRRRPAARPVEIELDLLGELSLELDWPVDLSAAEPGEIDEAVERLIGLGWQVDDEAEEWIDDDDGPEVPSAIAIPLVWRGARGVTPLDRAMRAFDAASAFTSLLPPASLFILVGFPDLPRVRPERSELTLRGPRLEIEAMRTLAREALEPQRPPGLSGRLRRLRPVDWLHLSVALGSGPAVELSFTQRPEVHLDVQVRSREHADPGADGRDAIERVVAGLARAGWKRAVQRA